MKKTNLLKRTLLLIGVLLLTLALAACGTKVAKTPVQGEVPVPPSPGVKPPEATQTVALYFSDWQAQHVIPERRQIAKAEGAALATQVVKELLAGPKDPHLSRALPENVKLLGDLTLQEDTALINFSAEFAQIRGTAAVTMALDSLVYSLTDLPGITKVMVLVEGKKGFDLEGNVMDRALTRGGIKTHPVLFDPERAKALQAQADQGPEAWRLDPKEVLVFEGRMFGFTADELKAATISAGDTARKAVVIRGGKQYLVLLKQEVTKGEKGIWSITEIAEVVQ